MKILFLGDSITEAVPGVSYVSMVQEEFKDSKIINRGIGGDTVSSLFKRVRKMHDLSSFDNIFLFIGVNDVFGKLTHSYKVLKFLKRQRHAKDISSFKEQYIMLINYILDSNKRVVIIPPFLIGEDINNKWNQELDLIIKAVESIAKHTLTPYLDIRSKAKKHLEGKVLSEYLPLKVFTLMKDVKFLKTDEQINQKSENRSLHLTLDGVHINTIGAKLISSSIISYINKKLGVK